jgi:hypothetical protein
MDFNEALTKRQFYKFTGPPEHWLTAIKYGTWALEEKYLERWKKIQTGDIFLIHSSAGSSSAFSNAQSGLIGIGVVGFNFSIDRNFFWYSEFRDRAKRWPLLVPITEFYLFSELSDPDTWGQIEPGNEEQISKLVDRLLSNRVSLSEVTGFPQMGSFNGVSFNTTQQVLSKNKPFHLYSRHSKRGNITEEDRPSTLTEVHNATETLRSAASLRFLPEVNEKIIRNSYSEVVRDNNILARAESAHLSVMQQLLDIFRVKGYDTHYNEYVDLFAHNENTSVLFEVKSNENKNFRVQARKGIAQLFEYDYFEIGKYKKEKGIDFEHKYKILALSQEPTDENYIQFINSLDLGVTTVEDGSLKPVGFDSGFSQI